MVPETWNDPGGPVWHGPVSDTGADSEMYWRVEPDTKLLVQIEGATPGTGTNGGNWQWKQHSNGAYFYLTKARIVHKQVHAMELDEAYTTPGTTACTVPQNPWGFPEGVTLNQGGMGMPSTVGSVIAVPEGTVGRPAIWAVVQEDKVGLPIPPGASYGVQLDYAYKASPWAPGSAPVPGALTSDGSNDAVGLFMGPGDAVPPGLRSVAGAITYTPGSGTAPPSASVGVIGWGVELAVIEGGYLILVKEDPLAAADELVHNSPWAHEIVDMADSYALDIEKNLTESVAVGDYVTVELNPPVFEQELVTTADSVLLTLNP